jgi:hypothetical protein
MGFLDKLLGRKKSEDDGLQTAPPPATMPQGDVPEHSHGEEEHIHEPEDKPGTSS